MNTTYFTTDLRIFHKIQSAIGATMIRLLIVEDQPGVRKGLQMRLDAEADLLVIGEASDGEAAVNLVSSLCPDVVLMDVEMPRMDGIATTGALLLVRPQTAVIMLSLHDDVLTQARAKDAGAAAFVAKSMSADTLLRTIRQVAH
jgi:DNA-binding NarL/FixJ family response regulator